jgi:anti-anti-sigma factor
MANAHDIESAHDGPFGLRAFTSGTICRVRLQGEFDLAAVSLVEDALERAYEGDVRVLDIDLAPLTFLDSSGLRVILGARDRAARHGVELRLRRGGETVQRVFAITGLDAELPFVDEPCG